MSDAEIKALYASNSDFKAYVDKYSAYHSEGAAISPSEALEHKIVHEVARRYMEENNK